MHPSGRAGGTGRSFCLEAATAHSRMARGRNGERSKRYCLTKGGPYVGGEYLRWDGWESKEGHDIGQENVQMFGSQNYSGPSQPLQFPDSLEMLNNQTKGIFLGRAYPPTSEEGVSRFSQF